MGLVSPFTPETQMGGLPSKALKIIKNKPAYFHQAGEGVAEAWHHFHNGSHFGSSDSVGPDIRVA